MRPPPRQAVKRAQEALRGEPSGRRGSGLRRSRRCRSLWPSFMSSVAGTVDTTLAIAPRHPKIAPVSDKAPWITYRPELKVLDCTIRDGGLINNSQFTDEQVRAVYQACIAAGVDYMEIGYKNDPAQFPKAKFGPWRHCEEADMRRVVGDHTFEATGLKLSAMADAGGKCDWKNQIIPAKESVLDVIRVACYVHQVSEAVEMVEHCAALGYETTLNIMAISVVADADIDQALEIGSEILRRHHRRGGQLREPLPRADRPPGPQIHQGRRRHRQARRHARP